MRAARIHQFGTADVITVDEIPCPTPGPGQVLIKVAATSMNPTEAALRAGLLRAIVATDFPLTLGWDVAGVVVGPDVGGHRTGDRVIGWIEGAAAEYAVADASALVSAPTTVPLADAAALPLAGLTAWQVIEAARLTEGEVVLINGAGGGIGGFAVQLAKRTGARVIATAGPRSASTVRAQGADTVIDYTTTAVEAVIGDPVDVVVNLVPLGATRSNVLTSLAGADGRIVSATDVITAPNSTHIVADNDPVDLARSVRLIDRGELTLDISERHTLDDLATLHRRSEAGELRGKVVVAV
ncbi:NADP-dependent oxidoreductase [Nocardia sp. NPDC058705]|uniref:NADP-dependent oxidoreductase n=1 Tax=Nocardia sp. NPDC058705 TaxID=3346609 RepID=UPI0036754D96